MNISKTWISFIIVLIMTIPLMAVETEDTLRVYESQDTIVVIADRFALPLKAITYTHQVIPGEIINTYSTHSALQLVDMAFPSAYTLDKKVLGYGYSGYSIHEP